MWRLRSLKMKKTILLSILLWAALAANSQSWQWGRRAGSTWTLPNSNEETPIDMATDNMGNVYILSLVYPNSLLSVDTSYVGNFFTSNASNVLLHSYSCDGSLRWKKIIGTASGSYAKSVQTDTLGGVYVLAKIFTNGTPIHVSNDTSFVNGNKQLYIIKFDTAGTLKWMRTPLPDTISFNNSFYNANPIDMHVDKAGNVTMFAEMPAGNNLNGALTLTSPAPFALRYNRFGTYISATPIPFIVTGLRATYRMSCFATIAANGNFVFSGYRFYIPEDTVFAGSTILNGRSFLIVADPNGQLLWYKEPKVADTSMLEFSNTIFTSRASTDPAGNIYISGCAAPNDTLDDFLFVNTSQPAGSAMPLIAKFTPGGHLEWVQVGSNNAIALAYGINYRNNLVAVTGLYSNYHMSFIGSPLFLGHQPNEGRDPFLAIFDAINGNLLALDSLHGLFGYDETGYIVTSDEKSNFFVAGSFEPYMVIAGNALQTSGAEDIFIAKYGVADCNFPVSAAIPEMPDYSNIILYPNPTNGKLYIDCRQLQFKTLEIYDLLGNSICYREMSEKASELIIDLNGLPKAVYVLKLTSKERITTCRKILLQ
jgi:hypothetical protein